MAKNSLRILKDVLLRYMKMAKATRRLPTPWNGAAAQWLRSSSILKEQGPLRTGLVLVVQRSWVHVLSFTSKCFLWKIGAGVLSALLQRLKRWGVSLLVLRPYATLYIKLVCMSVRGLAINGYILSYFEGKINLHCYISCTQTTFHCVKVSFCQYCPMKRYT